MSLTTQSFVIAALPAGDLDRIRATGEDDFGNPVRQIEDETGGSPLRCCLREARAGEDIALIAYRPFPWLGPYAEVGPVFIHAQACDGYTAPDRYPVGFAHRRQLLRAYDFDRRICDAVPVKDGPQAERVLSWLLSRPEVDFVHSRNLEWGCYMFSVSCEVHAAPSEQDTAHDGRRLASASRRVIPRDPDAGDSGGNRSGQKFSATPGGAPRTVSSVRRSQPGERPAGSR
jgi:hypothetical protein